MVNRSNRPVYRSKPVTHAILNLDLNSNRSNRPVNRYEPVELSFLNSNLNSIGTDRFQPNRTDIPVPDPGGLATGQAQAPLPLLRLRSPGACPAVREPFAPRAGPAPAAACRGVAPACNLRACSLTCHFSQCAEISGAGYLFWDSSV